MYQILHKSNFHKGIVLNLLPKSPNYLTSLFTKAEAEQFVIDKNKNALDKNLSIRYAMFKIAC